MAVGCDRHFKGGRLQRRRAKFPGGWPDPILADSPGHPMQVIIGYLVGD